MKIDLILCAGVPAKCLGSEHIIKAHLGGSPGLQVSEDDMRVKLAWFGGLEYQFGLAHGSATYAKRLLAFFVSTSTWHKKLLGSLSNCQTFLLPIIADICYGLDVLFS